MGGAGQDADSASLPTVCRWALGVLLVEMLTGASPFAADGDEATQAGGGREVVGKW